MTLYDVFDRLELTALGQLISDSIWLFPVVEAGHLIGLGLLGGSILVVDLRLLGLGLTARSPAYLLMATRPWFVAALLVMFGTGVPLFVSEAVKCYWSYAFWVKMGALVLALGFTFGVRNRIVNSQPELEPWLMRVLGVSSIALWLTVAAAGRWIGFS
ncbi:MAG: hypothetical protein H8E78_05750 [Proteobacteria bacterium]|jgi:hypothetical protein|nr:hypothetical protein [Pseudomonadota bacterium]